MTVGDPHGNGSSEYGMEHPFRSVLERDASGYAELPIRFDATRQTPALIKALASGAPWLEEALAILRTRLPLARHARPGAAGSFIRLPNHYRSVSFAFQSEGGPSGYTGGAIVFKGTEPLLPDFERYFEWMLSAPFRGSALPLGLHFALDTGLPPGAMWIKECLMEQEAASTIQAHFLQRHGTLAKLPVPLVVYQLERDDVDRYTDVVRPRISAAAFRRIEAKLTDGLGVEVYYYPTIPVRAADLHVASVRSMFNAALGMDALEGMFGGWIAVLAELLQLGYMPYAPWNHGRGACVDPGNACIDGGFNDLLTVVPFDSIPGEHLFWRSLHSSVQLLATSILTVCAAVVPTRPQTQSEPAIIATSYVNERLRAHIRTGRSSSHALDARLLRYFEVPRVQDVLAYIGETHSNGGAAQFTAPNPVMTTHGS